MFLSVFYTIKYFSHIYECSIVNYSWLQLVQHHQLQHHKLPFFSILDSANNGFIFKNNKVFINHILLILKKYVYKSRKKLININLFLAEIRIGKNIEKSIVFRKQFSKKTTAFTKKLLKTKVLFSIWIELNRFFIKKQINHLRKILHKNGMG